MGQAEVSVFEVLDVSHHFRLRAVTVKDRMVQVIDLPSEGAKERRVETNTLHRADTQGGAKRCEILVVGALVQGHPDVLAVREVAKVHTLGFGTSTKGLHRILTSFHTDFQRVEVARADHLQVV